MSDSVSWGVQETFSTETHRMKEEEASEEEVDQTTISQYFQYLKPISPELKLGKPMTKKKRTRGPKFGAKKVFSGHDLRKSKTCKRKRVIYDSSEDSEVETNIVMERAKEIQENLDPNFPSFIKLMLRSHVTKGFWMGLPSSFCKLHLPKCDKTIVLEGESGKEYETNFLADKCGLSGGWKAFSAAHKLIEGDVVVFQLVQPFKFKMYIVRANDMAEVDGALGLLSLNVSTRESDFETINIAKAIRACNLSTSREDFALWDKTLEAFELLGMKAGFLRGRLNRLVSFAFDPVREAESKRIMEARLERDHAQDEVITLEQKLMELKRIRDGLDDEIEGLKMNEEIDEFFFHEEANASW